MLSLRIALSTLFTCVALPALGAGYGLKEHSADAMAAAYAGAAATSSDASYLAYNPAALAGVADDDLSVSLVAILPGSKATYTTATTSAGNPTGGSPSDSGFISDALVPAFALRHRLSDRWTMGVNVSAPWGLRTDYPSNWAGRYYADKTELLTINATPSIAYQLTPGIAVGAGLQVEFAQGTLTSVIDTGTLGALNLIPGSIPGGQDSFARLSGHDWAFGYTIGATAKLTDEFTVGLSYRSSLKHTLKGPLTFTLDGAGVGATLRAVTGLFTNTTQSTALTMPDMVLIGARHDFGNWSLLGELDWTNWSKFRELRVVAANAAQPNDVTTTRWENTIFASLGVEYRASPLWTFSGGIGYDESPVPDTTREPRIPDADRLWLSGGARYRMTENIDVNLTLSRLFNRKTNVTLNPAIPGAALRGTLNGTTESYVNVAGLQLSWRP
ncbi:MAG: outer membrane protein transport protein [Alphaproteobacteria bacterium]|nr:outer membrane protein transport protein [Alphaproteobacteria bacterium]MBV9419196.1 outer membrane protein transport protein [Alphaproteobacteria bacterium]MBV9541312.1 outer membrane protein transport protein [Alphaproteobacteria bacterium]MBV9904989.1 outer membrane protein transport protein [Alphaproteobacteria bacterium]